MTSGRECTGFRRLLAKCPHCGSTVLFTAEVGPLQEEYPFDALIPVEAMMEAAGPLSTLQRRKKTLVCPSRLCEKRFSLLLPALGSSRTARPTG